MSTYDAIVPAGGTIDPEFAKLVGTDQKALIEFQGQSILSGILKALRESGVVRNIVVVGSSEVQNRAADFAAIGIAPGQSGPDNIFKGVEKLAQLDPDLRDVLIVTSDLPFLTAQGVRDYIALCPADKDICVAVVDAQTFNKTYPGTTSTFVSTKDGLFTLGGMFLMNAKKMPELRSSIERVFARRKSKLGMAALIGPMFIAKWMTKTLTIADLENKIQSLLGCSGKAIRGAPPELAFDIDYRDDYEYALQRFGEPK